MRICHAISITTVVLLVALTTSASALQVQNVLERGKVYTDGPLPKGDHEALPPQGADACPADIVNGGVPLTDGDQFSGSTIG